MKSLDFWNCFVISLSLLSSVTPITIYPECQPKSKWTSEWLGSNASFITWVGEKSGTENKQKQNIFIIRYTFKELDHSENFNLITIYRSEAEIAKLRNGVVKREKVIFTEPIGYGWQEFAFSVRFEAEMWYNSVRLMTVEKKYGIHELTMDGSNVTVNCHKNEFQWTATSKEPALIPMAFEEGKQTIGFYSNYRFNPVISLTNIKESATLGWNGSSIVEKGSPLREATEYRVSIFCQRTNYEILCTLEEEQSEMRLKNFYPFSMPDTLHVSAGREEGTTIQVVLHLPPRPTFQVTSASPSLTDTNRTHIRSDGYKDEGNTTALIISLVAVTIAFLLLAALVAVLLYKIRKRFKWLSTKESFEILLTSTMRAYSEMELMSLSPSKFTDDVEPKLWDAVAKNDVEQAQSLLLQGVDPFKIEEDRQTTAYIEAHLLGYKGILQILSRHQGNREVTRERNLIKSIIMELQIRERKIFSAARNGRYGTYNGVKLLLEAYSLPATIYDHQRLSLIHYIASACFTNGVPAWDAKDIHEFFSNHEYYINAVDSEGNTALHMIASRQAVDGNDGELYTWSGKSLSLEDIWIRMAEIFLDYDCDPRIKNHRGILAQVLAKEYEHHELANLLKKKCESLGKVDYSVTADRFSEMVDAVRRGETTKIIALLKCGVPLLPINAHADPLVDAIRCNQRDTVILLVGAGAPLGNQSIGNITPLEAAHTTVDLPAVIPALIRKALGDMLREEGLRIGLKIEMAMFRIQVIEAGCEARWKFESDTKKDKDMEARKLLLQAAEQGCYIFCQMLSQEDVHLHSKRREENAFRKAVENNQVHTQLTLCRDLKMSPMTFTFSALESLNRDLGTSILTGQIRILRGACKNPSDPFLQGALGMTIDQCINDLQRFCDVDDPQHIEIGEPLDTLLYAVAKEGLDAILYVLLTKCTSFDINKEICFSKSTLLHVAAMNGQINMIEFLLFHKAKLDLVTVGGYTAAHLAALGGHEEAFLYIEEHMKNNNINVNAKCKVGLTASELMANYSKVCESLTIPLISHKDALTVMNEKANSDKAYEILRRKGEALNITEPQALFDCVEKNTFSGEDMIYILKKVSEEVGEICNVLKNSDFGGILSLMGPLQEETEIFNVSDVHFTLNLEAFHCMDHTAPVTYEGTPNSNHTTFILRHNSKPELFKGTNFIEEFSKAMETALLSYKSSPDKISLCSPFLSTSVSEVSFCLLLKKDEYFIKIAVHVLPVIAISFPKESRIKEDYEECIKSNTGNAQICLFNSEGEWIFHPHHFEKCIFQNLNESQRKVRRACHLISKLLDPWPWAPPFSAKHFIRPWHTLSVGVDFLQPEAVNSLFLRECTKNSSPWTEDTVFQKLLSLYQHAAEKDIRGTWTVQKNIDSSVFIRVYYKNNDSVCGVIRYLEYLKKRKGS